MELNGKGQEDRERERRGTACRQLRGVKKYYGIKFIGGLTFIGIPPIFLLDKRISVQHKSSMNENRRSSSWELKQLKVQQ